MNILRKLLAASAAVVVAVASGAVVAHADSTPSVYNTPGGQMSGGRLWDTTCEMYSSNVVRCRANIWATQVQYREGRYVSVTGWTFNNLSYLPSPRASWAGNNLARNNDRWISGGRTWRTECDTAMTGRGGCRSFVWTKQGRRVGGGHVAEHRWVFNNLVLFSSASVPAVTEVPDSITDQLALDFDGLVPGPVRHGVSLEDLVTLGYFTRGVGGCDYVVPGDDLRDLGVSSNSFRGTLGDVTIMEPDIPTVDGARVGMTIGEFKAIYGNRLRTERKDTQGQPIHTAVVNSGGYELVFVSSYRVHRPLVDSDVITEMTSRKILDYIVGAQPC